LKNKEITLSVKGMGATATAAIHHSALVRAAQVESMACAYPVGPNPNSIFRMQGRPMLGNKEAGRDDQSESVRTIKASDIMVGDQVRVREGSTNLYCLGRVLKINLDIGHASGISRVSYDVDMSNGPSDAAPGAQDCLRGGHAANEETSNFGAGDDDYDPMGPATDCGHLGMAGHPDSTDIEYSVPSSDIRKIPMVRTGASYRSALGQRAYVAGIGVRARTQGSPQSYRVARP